MRPIHDPRQVQQRNTLDKVFITHSKHDAPILRYIRQLVEQAHVSPTFYQYDPTRSTTAWEEIKGEIQNSNALFLVLSSNLGASPHTQNWVGLEVGIACSFSKRVWVFEEINQNVLFPIPYLTDYLPYDLSNPELQQLITSAARAYNYAPQRGSALGLGILGGALFGPPGILGGIILGSIANSPQSPPFVDLMCYHLDCKTRFKMYVWLPEFTCPACRRVLRFKQSQQPDGNFRFRPEPRYGELAYDSYCWFNEQGQVASFRAL